ncbi:MAG: branched-chain amino acid ABC transporter substrate-binding protein [Anaerolineales bacterium]
MKRLSVLIVALLVLAAVVVPSAAQDDGEGVVVVPAGETIKLGMAVDLSNLLPAPGEDMANAANLAVMEYNEDPFIEGFEVELLVEDDRCAPEDATSVANLFAADPEIVGVVGHMCSGASIAASEIYVDARIPMVSPSSTARAFTDRGLDITFRTAFNDGVQGLVAARFIMEVVGAENVAILHDNSDYGLGLATVVQETLEEAGTTVSAFEVIDPEEQDYRSQLTVLAGESPDLIYFGGYQNQAAGIVEQMQEVGLGDAILFSADGVYTQDFLDLAGESADGTHVTFGSGLGQDEDLDAEFDAAYEEEFGVAPDELGPFHAQAYDAANVLLNAIAEVAEVDGDGNLIINREALIEAIGMTAGYQGVSGTVTCTENGDCGSIIIAVFAAEDGEWVEVEVPAELQVFDPEAAE